MSVAIMNSEVYERLKAAEEQLAAANERCAALEAGQEWESVPFGEVIRLPSEEPDTGVHPVRGRIYHTFETADGQRIVIALPDNVRIMRRRPQETE